ncbi:MAG: helix-turn-helix domain-containing protein [Firmicutes bacterium]|nr:helix-turn-helix domain-containing protein [Bacillota bacterium]
MMFKDNLISLRKMNRMSQEELAERIGVTRQTLSKYETGESLPDIEKSRAIADAFGISLDELVNADDRMLLPGSTPKGKYIFGVVKVGDKGQIVLPVKARRVFGINPGDSVVVLGADGQGIAIIKEQGFLDMVSEIRKMDKE